MCWWRFCVSVVKKSFSSVLLLRDLCVGWSVSWRFLLDVQCCSKCPLGWALKSIGCLYNKMFAFCGSGVFVCSIVWTQRRLYTFILLKVFHHSLFFRDQCNYSTPSSGPVSACVFQPCSLSMLRLFRDTVSASPLPNWLPLAWLRDATMDAASNDRRSRLKRVGNDLICIYTHIFLNSYTFWGKLHLKC